MGLFASWQLDPGRRSSFQIRLLRAAGLACGIVWGLTSWSFSDPPPASGSTVRVMTWNLGHGRRGLEQLAAEAAEFQPDLAVFVEADPARTDIRAVFRAAFPEHHVAILGGGIVLVSRWPEERPGLADRNRNGRKPDPGSRSRHTVRHLDRVRVRLGQQHRLPARTSCPGSRGQHSEMPVPGDRRWRLQYASRFRASQSTATAATRGGV